MKLLLLVVLFILVLGTVSALPTTGAEDLDDPEELLETRSRVRTRRFTCDILSWGGIVNHSACALHCLMLRRRGGYCYKGVCHCRK